MFAPIRSTTSSEVRRVDEVSPRKGVTERSPSPFAQTADGVRITIGADARKLASGGGDSSPDEGASETESPSETNEASEFAAEEQVYSAPVRGFLAPFATSEGATARGAGANSEFANRALQSFVTNGARTNSALSSGIGDDFEQVWTAEESTKVPFEVLQRAVTQATGRGGPTPSKANVSSPVEPLFSPPENGGEPYGREVPFESEGRELPPELPIVGASAENSARGKRLSSEQAGGVIANLKWSPATATSSGSQSSAGV